ncbi:hypothetical protein [Pseudomonas sp. BN102]|uniref:hypothetical protein n=1 Tax=Pseudomonas sp. BN102 TaxID=2567886 RepID=UPI00245698E6|nr:hypothetical protein [Pseudomonas sp. BN102]MDH4610268.1 hypothetical protein [Pseudomonas sp. BN102]
MRNLFRLALDQGISSLSLFIFSVSLAREFGASDFSLFATSLSSSLIVIAILNSAFIEPNAISQQNNISAPLILKLALTLSIFATFICLITTEIGNAPSILVFTVGNSVLYSARRINTLTGEHNKLYAASIFSLASISAATLALSHTNTTINNWLFVYGLIGIATAFTIKNNSKQTKIKPQPDLNSLIAAIMVWLCTNFYFYYLPASGHPEISGQLRMLLTLFMPALQLGTILGSLLITGKTNHKKSLGLSLAASILYGSTLTIIGPDTLEKITNIELPIESLLLATLMAVAMNLSGITSISARIKKRAKTLIISSSSAAFALIISSPLANNLNFVIIAITSCFIVGTMLTTLIPIIKK